MKIINESLSNFDINLLSVQEFFRHKPFRLVNLNKFTSLLSERTKDINFLNKKELIKLINFGLIHKIQPIIISHHLPELIGSRSPYRFTMKFYHHLLDPVIQDEFDLTDLHIQYWFHPYQVFDYYQLLQLYPIKDSKLFKVNFRLRIFIQNLLPILLFFDKTFLPYIQNPEVEKYLYQEFKGKNYLQSFNFTIQQLRNSRESIIQMGESLLNMNSDLISLIEFADQSYLKSNLKNEVLLGYELLEIAEVLRLFTQIHSGEREKLRREIRSDLKYEKAVYGEIPEKQNKMVLSELVMRFDLSAEKLTLLICEGDTDKLFLENILESIDYMYKDRIRIIPANGTNKSAVQRIIAMIQQRIDIKIPKHYTWSSNTTPIYSKFPSFILYFDPEGLFRQNVKQKTIENIKSRISEHLEIFLPQHAHPKYFQNFMKFNILDEPREFNYLDNFEIKELFKTTFSIELNEGNIEKFRNLPLSNFSSLLSSKYNIFRWKKKFAKISAKFLSEKYMTNSDKNNPRMQQFSKVIEIIKESIRNSYITDSFENL